LPSRTKNHSTVRKDGLVTEVTTNLMSAASFHPWGTMPLLMSIPAMMPLLMSIPAISESAALLMNLPAVSKKKLAALLMSCPAISEICSSCRYIRPRVGFRIDKQSPLRTIYSKSFPTQNNRTIFPKPSPAQSHLSKSFLTQTTNQPIQFDSHSLQPGARGF